MSDPIIDEIHRLREEALAEVDFDHHRFCERLREHEKQSSRPVQAPPRRPKQPVTNKLETSPR